MSFLRVKRKCEEDPKEVLLLASKKFKLQEISDQVPIFELASSAVEEKDLNNIIINTIKNRDVKSHKRDLEQIRTRIREENVERNRNNRYKLWAATRKLDDETTELSVSVIDVLDNGPEKDENQNEYVFDLYYSSMSVDVTDPEFSANHVLHDVSDGFNWEFESEDEEQAPDDDDSNDENNWRNDYPDEEDDTQDESDDENYLTKKLERTRLSSDYSLSSGEEDYYNDYYESCDFYEELASDSDDES